MVDGDLDGPIDERFDTRAQAPAARSGGRTWRLSTGFVWLGVVAVLAGGSLVACGDDDSDGGDADAAGAESGGEGGVGSIEDFCAAMERINVQVDSSGYFEPAEGGSDAVVLEVVQGVDAPDEIADEWATLVDGTEQAIELENDADFEETAETEATEAAAERVLSYVDVQCSVDLSSEPL